MSDPIMSPDGNFMWTGSEWIPAPPSAGSNNNEYARLFDELSVENAEQPQQSLSIQDSVIMGGVNQVFNDEDAISSIAESSIIEVKCSEIKNAIRLGDKDMVVSSVNSLAEYCNSNNRLAKVEQFIRRSDRQKMYEEMIGLVRNIDVYSEHLQSDNVFEYTSHFGKLVEDSNLMHNTAISLNSISEYPNDEDVLQLFFSRMEYDLDCMAKLLEDLPQWIKSRSMTGDARINLIIDMGRIVADEMSDNLKIIYPPHLGPEWNLPKLKVKRKLENIDIHLRKAKNHRMIKSGILTPTGFVCTIFSYFGLEDAGVPLLGILACIFPFVGFFIYGIFMWSEKNSLQNLSETVRIYAGLFSDMNLEDLP